MAQKRRWNALLSDSKAFFTDWVGGVLLCIYYYCPCCVAQLPPPQLYIYYQPPSCYKPSSARMEGQKPLNHPCFSTDSRKWKCKSRVVESAAHIHIHSTFFCTGPIYLDGLVVGTRFPSSLDGDAAAYARVCLSIDWTSTLGKLCTQSVTSAGYMSAYYIMFSKIQQPGHCTMLNIFSHWI